MSFGFTYKKQLFWSLRNMFEKFLFQLNTKGRGLQSYCDCRRSHSQESTLTPVPHVVKANIIFVSSNYWDC